MDLPFLVYISCAAFFDTPATQTRPWHKSAGARLGSATRGRRLTASIILGGARQDRGWAESRAGQLGPRARPCCFHFPIGLAIPDMNTW